MLFWHLGGTIAITRNVFRDDRMDLRFLALGALIPDLVDTPIGLAFFGSLHSVRLIGHSLLAAALVMTIVVLRTRRGRPRKRWMPLAIGMLLHLLLDAMWSDAATLWWPFLGVDFTPSGAATAGAYVTSILTDWRVWAFEAVGLVYLVVLGRNAHLATAEARSRLITTGTVDVPIERR